MTADQHTAFWPYAAAIVIFLAGSAVLLVLMASAWRRIEDAIRDHYAEPSNVVPFPSSPRVVGKDGAA